MALLINGLALIPLEWRITDGAIIFPGVLLASMHILYRKHLNVLLKSSLTCLQPYCSILSSSSSISDQLDILCFNFWLAVQGRGKYAISVGLLDWLSGVHSDTASLAGCLVGEHPPLRSQTICRLLRVGHHLTELCIFSSARQSMHMIWNNKRDNARNPCKHLLSYNVLSSGSALHMLQLCTFNLSVQPSPSLDSARCQAIRPLLCHYVFLRPKLGPS